jgi:hypothetical protein
MKTKFGISCNYSTSYQDTEHLIAEALYQDAKEQCCGSGGSLTGSASYINKFLASFFLANYFAQIYSKKDIVNQKVK